MTCEIEVTVNRDLYYGLAARSVTGHVWALFAPVKRNFASSTIAGSMLQNFMF
jgi:hypothetical protein